jgi:hypothetical protein
LPRLTSAKARGGFAGSAFEAESILQALLAEEEERVAEAIAFAEVLVPMLAERLRPWRRSGARAARRAPRQGPPETPVEPRGIADFIDDMLAQERAGPR